MTVLPDVEVVVQDWPVVELNAAPGAQPATVEVVVQDWPVVELNAAPGAQPATVEVVPPVVAVVPPLRFQ